MKLFTKLSLSTWIISTLALLVFSITHQQDNLNFYDDLHPALETALIAGIFIWIVSTIHLLLKLFRGTEFREQIFFSMTKANERDERELILSGEAARKSIVNTMVAIFIIMGASLINVKVAKRHDVTLEKPGYFSVGIGLAKQNISKDETVMFEYNLSKYPPFIFVVFLLFFMMGSYRYNFKKLSKMDEEV